MATDVENLTLLMWLLLDVYWAVPVSRIETVFHLLCMPVSAPEAVLNVVSNVE